jgi:hypothetical protein
MPLTDVQTVHVRVGCDSCSASAELCGKRDAMSRVAAVQKFKATGWHHDTGSHRTQSGERSADRVGSGRWYCPACAKKTHL